MSKTAFEENLEARAELFQALGHPVRLLILNLVQMKPRHGEELATILGLTPATISHHLAKLTGVGLLQSEKVQYYQTYTMVHDVLNKALDDVVRLPQPELDIAVEEDAYRKKVLATFFKHGRLTQIPAQRKKRLIILEKLVQRFEPERRYTEREVNYLLLDFHEDVATLRRELIVNGLMERERDVYWRAADRVVE